MVQIMLSIKSKLHLHQMIKDNLELLLDTRKQEKKLKKDIDELVNFQQYIENKIKKLQKRLDKQ